MRDRLIELLINSGASFERALPEEIADYLLANGVIVPPCKVGDTVWEIEYEIGYDTFWEKHPFETEVKAICLLTENDYYSLDRVGKDVFLTRAEAEKECENNDR